MDLKVVCQKNEANEKNAPGTFIHCRGKTPGTNRLSAIHPGKNLLGGAEQDIQYIQISNYAQKLRTLLNN